MLDDAAQNRKPEFRRDALARRVAKRAAKRPNERLTAEEAEELINQLFRCELPQYTPGGKTTYRIVEAEQLRDWLEKN
jgi:DNA mismatch repair protein MutL